MINVLRVAPFQTKLNQLSSSLLHVCMQAQMDGQVENIMQLHYLAISLNAQQ